MSDPMQALQALQSREGYETHSLGVTPQSSGFNANSTIQNARNANPYAHTNLTPQIVGPQGAGALGPSVMDVSSQIIQPGGITTGWTPEQIYGAIDQFGAAVGQNIPTGGTTGGTTTTGGTGGGTTGGGTGGTTTTGGTGGGTPNVLDSIVTDPNIPAPVPSYTAPPPAPAPAPAPAPSYAGSLWTDGDGNLLTWDQVPGGVRRHIETNNPTWYSDTFKQYGV